MNQIEQGIYQAIANNNIARAKDEVLLLCTKDKTEKNKRFCADIIARIKEQPKVIPLPYDVQGCLYHEDVALSFNEQQYFISEREQALCARLMTMQHTAEQLQAAGINYRNAALLFGPSGSGKTAFAKYLALTMNRQFYMVNLGGIVDSLMGGTSKNLTKIFARVSETGAPAILFLDELDAISVKRDNTAGRESGSDQEMSRATMVIMQQLDMLSPQTVIIAATNRMDLLDDAIKRRFPVHHKFSEFSDEEREHMIRKYLIAIQQTGTFPLTWDDTELAQFAMEKKNIPNATVIESVVHSLADMVEHGKENLNFSIKKF